MRQRRRAAPSRSSRTAKPKSKGGKKKRTGDDLKFGMDESARRWLLKTAHTNLWRVPSWMDFEDVVAEGELSYAKALAKYGHKAKNRRHLMSLFMIIYTNRLHDLAKARTLQQNEFSYCRFTDETVAQIEESLLECEFSSLLQRLTEFPPAVASLIRAMHQTPELLRRPYKNSKRHGRETLNERLCRLMGLNPDETDLHGQLTATLQG